MPLSYQIQVLPDGPVTGFAGSRDNYYEFADGSRIELRSTPVWCHRCGSVTHGEEIESLAEIDRTIADLQDPVSERDRSFRVPPNPSPDERLMAELLPHESREEVRLDMLAAATKRRAWRATRTSPPKCIACGSADIFVFPVNRPAPNPVGPGTILVRSIGLCSTDAPQRFFTPEGDRIARNTPYCHPWIFNMSLGMRQWLRELPRWERPTGDEGN